MHKEILPNECDWIVASNKKSKRTLVLKDKASVFNFKVGRVLTIGFLDEYQDITTTKQYKVAENDGCRIICKEV